MKKIFLTILALGLIVGINAFFQTNNISAQTKPNMSGYAWSDTIGWISMSRVTMADDGVLTGYGWSENIGWVKFGGLSGFPSASGNTQTNAKIDMATGKASGWARACYGMAASVMTDPNNSCSGASRIDGSDGWISLAGGTKYGITLDKNTGKFAGYGWGSDVIGWVDFSAVTYLSDAIDKPLTDPASLTFQGYKTSAGSSTASSTVSIKSGDKVTLTWASTSLNNCMSFSSNNESAWPNGAAQNANGNKEVSPTAQTTYEIHCKDVNDNSDYKPGGVWPTVQVNVGNGVLTLTASPNPAPNSNPTTTLTYSGSGITAGSCSASTPSAPPATAWTGARTVTASAKTESVSVPETPTTYRLICTEAGTGNQLLAEVSVGVSAPAAPTLNFSASPTKLPAGGGNTTLTWSTSNASSCTASSTNSSNPFSGSKSTSGSQSVDMKSEATRKTTTYTMTCNGASGSATKSVQVTIGDCKTNGCQPKAPVIIEL